VKPGDVLTAVNDAPVADPQGMLNQVAGLQPGSSAKLKVRRQAQTLELTVTVGRRPKPQPRE
jgi:S1-C subfamily serine protease